MMQRLLHRVYESAKLGLRRLTLDEAIELRCGEIDGDETGFYEL